MNKKEVKSFLEAQVALLSLPFDPKIPDDGTQTETPSWASLPPDVLDEVLKKGTHIVDIF